VKAWMGGVTVEILHKALCALPEPETPVGAADGSSGSDGSFYRKLLQLFRPAALSKVRAPTLESRFRSIWAHQFGVTGLFSAPKLTNL